MTGISAASTGGVLVNFKIRNIRQQCTEMRSVQSYQIFDDNTSIMRKSLLVHVKAQTHVVCESSLINMSTRLHPLQTVRTCSH